MSDYADLELKMNNMKLNERRVTAQLKETHSALNNIIQTADFGMKEDRDFIVPVKPSHETAEMMEVRLHKKREKINENVRIAQVMMMKIHRSIDKYQTYNYKTLMTKRRAFEHESEEKTKRKNKRKEKEARNEEDEMQAKRIRNYKSTRPLYELLDVKSSVKGFESNDSDSEDNLS